jgi:hypothetical protein
MAVSLRKRVYRTLGEIGSGMKPSEYLVKFFKTVLPLKIAEFWDKNGTIAIDGTIVFDDITEKHAEFVRGYLVRGAGKPHFGDELAKFLSRYLFSSDPNFRVYACIPGQVCEAHNGVGHFEFEVLDKTGNILLFTGTVLGLAREKRKDGATYIEFVPSSIIVKPEFG